MGIHYDMYPISGESINIFMFELLILRCINNGSNGIFHLPAKARFMIEITQALNDPFINNQFLFSFPPKVKISWNAKNIKVGTVGTDRYQMVAKYLMAIESNNYDYNVLLNEEAVLPVSEC